MEELWMKFKDIKVFYHNPMSPYYYNGSLSFKGDFKNGRPIYVNENYNLPKEFFPTEKGNSKIYYDGKKWKIVYYIDRKVIAGSYINEKDDEEYLFLSPPSHCPLIEKYNEHIKELLEFITYKNIDEIKSEKLNVILSWLDKKLSPELKFKVLNKIRKIEVK